MRLRRADKGTHCAAACLAALVGPALVDECEGESLMVHVADVYRHRGCDKPSLVRRRVCREAGVLALFSLATQRAALCRTVRPFAPGVVLCPDTALRVVANDPVCQTIDSLLYVDGSGVIRA